MLNSIRFQLKFFEIDWDSWGSGEHASVERRARCSDCGLLANWPMGQLQIDRDSPTLGTLVVDDAPHCRAREIPVDSAGEAHPDNRRLILW
jgi:hypothetical protein